jgi:hypothetical protein
LRFLANDERPQPDCISKVYLIQHSLCHMVLNFAPRVCTGYVQWGYVQDLAGLDVGAADVSLPLTTLA